MKAGKTKLSVNVTTETIDILKEMAEEYGSTIGISVTMLAKNWKKEKDAIRMIQMAEAADVVKAMTKTI